MIPKELIDYIKGELQKKADPEKIRALLLTNGWKEQDIKNAFDQLANESSALSNSQNTSQSTLPYKTVTASIAAPAFIMKASGKQNTQLANPAVSKPGGFLRNFFSIDFYVNIASGRQNFKPALIALIFALILSVKPSIFIIKAGYPFVANLESSIVSFVNEVYPAQLEIKIKNGYVSTNVSEPYYITVSKETLESFPGIKKESNSISKIRLLAIDTKGKAEEFEKYQSYALLTQTSIVYYNEGNIQIYPLRNIQELTINKQIIKNIISEFNRKFSLANILKIGLYTLPLFIVLFIFLSYLSIFFVSTIPVYFMAKINQVPLNFKASYNLTAAVSLLPLIFWDSLSFIPQLALLAKARTPITVIILTVSYIVIRKLKT